mgnify:CR=1 FL=1
MRKHFDDQIAQLGEQMMAMGALVENTIERAIRALQTDDMAEAAAIRDGDHVVDEKEREVEAMCIHMLLQQQPVARDLRTISAALKMITDMERIGDQASDICEIATMGHLRSPRPEHFASMAQAAISMVHRAIDAYVHKDIELAQQVELSDDIVDALFNDVKADLIAGLRGHPDRTEECLDLLMIAKYFERIGDHAADIAEIIPHLVTVRKEGDPAVSQAIAMGKKAHQMILDALDALTAEDENAARRVIAADEEVDYDFNAIKHTLAQEIAADPAKVDAALDLLMVIKYLERIGDHAVNVAEWVQFVRTGHYKDESMF